MQQIVFIYIFLFFSFFSNAKESLDNAKHLKNQRASFNYIDVVKEYGITPNDDIDDSKGIQKAIDEAKGSVLYFRAGTYILETPLHYAAERLSKKNRFQNIDNPPGLKIIGEGINNTIFINRTDDYAIKVLGVKDSNGKIVPALHQTSGYFKDFSIYSSDIKKFKPKGGFMLISTYGFSFENISIIGSFRREFTQHAIYVPLIEEVYKELGFDTIEDLNTQFNTSFHKNFINPDTYSSWCTIFTNLIIDFCDGYGIYGQNGVGFGFETHNARISRCKTAGIFVSGHHCIIRGGSVFICGNSKETHSQTTGGIIVDMARNKPNNLEINNVEFHDNYYTDIDVRATVSGVIKNNKFITTFNKNSKYKDINVNHLGIRLGGYYRDYNYVRNIDISNNFFRYQNKQSVFTSMELHDRVRDCTIINNLSQPSNITTKSKLKRKKEASFFDIEKGFSKGGNFVKHKGKKVK